MISVLVLLLLLSLILFLYNQREGLDNCDTPPIKGSTAGEIVNKNQITNLQKQINDLDSHLRQQVATNTGQINNINSNIKGLGNLRQVVSGLSQTIKITLNAIQNLGQQFQQQSN
jgi:hypothetical protein